jgi:DNA-binding NtrC family response regulator
MTTQKKRVLVVDDEKDIRRLLSDFLSSEGFEVSVAKDGQESLDQMRVNSFDLVITELHMPRMDGIEMLKHMEQASRRVKVIVMTADPTDRRLSEIRMPHIVTQLNKPFRMDNFLNVVIAATAN